MLRRRPIGFAAAGLLALGACTSVQEVQQQAWYNKAHDASVKAAAVASDETARALAIASDQTARTLARMQHYLQEKDVLQTFHDAGEHSESVVLDVLHKSGVHAAAGGPAKSPAPRAGNGAHGTAGSGSGAPRTATAGGGTTAGGTAAGGATFGGSGLPEQYAGKLRWPLEAGIVSSEYGARWGKMHKGIDIAADAGEPVYAIAAGEVVYAGDGLRGYGNVVILRHDRQRTSLYAHNSVLKVKQGDSIAQGTVVALLGNTGHSTGPHVHFEIRDGDATVNPRSVLPATRLGDLVLDPLPPAPLEQPSPRAPRLVMSGPEPAAAAARDAASAP